MKSLSLFTCAALSLAFIFPTNILAVDAQPGAQTPAQAPGIAASHKGPKLPPMIKISPAHVDMTTTLVDNSMQNAKSAGQSITIDGDTIAKMLPGLEQSISTYRNKVNECKNKTFTTEDQKKAHCTDDMTLAQCSKYLFSWCTYTEVNAVIQRTIKLLDAAKKAETDAKDLYKNVQYINNNNSKYGYGN